MLLSVAHSTGAMNTEPGREWDLSLALCRASEAGH